MFSVCSLELPVYTSLSFSVYSLSFSVCSLGFSVCSLGFSVIGMRGGCIPWDGQSLPNKGGVPLPEGGVSVRKLIKKGIIVMDQEDNSVQWPQIVVSNMPKV